MIQNPNSNSNRGNLEKKEDNKLYKADGQKMFWFEMMMGEVVNYDGN